MDVVATILRASGLLATLLTITISLPSVSSRCTGPQEVYDIAFEFRGNCSMTVNWTTPNCSSASEVTSYIVQSAQGCPSRWKRYAVLTGSEHSVVIEDLALITSCLRGKCYIRVLAEIEHSNQSQRIHSHCVGLGDTFRPYGSPGATPKYYSYTGQQVCIPVNTICPPSTLPNFFINQQMIALSTRGSEEDDYYLRINNNMLEICISNHSETNSVIHEICHVNTECSLCPEDTGELVLMSRTEVQTLTPNATTIGPGDGSDPEQEVDCVAVPSVVRFCLTSYSINIDNTSVEVCVCLPLYELHGRGSEDMIIVELNLQINSTVPGNVILNVSPDDTVNLSPNMTPKCFNVDVPLMDIEYADNSTLEMCMALLGSTNATKCIHVPEPCVEIIVSNNTESEFDGDQTTTQEVDDNTTLGSITTTSGDIDESNHGLNDGVTAVIILLSIIIAFIGLLVILIILRIFWKKLCCNWKEYKIKSDHEMKPGTTETSQQTPKEINTDGKTTNVQEESDTEI